MAGNLTRDEARERARLLAVESYEVDLDLTTGDERFGSTTVIRFGCGEPGASTFIDLHGAEVREIVLNDRALDPATYDAGKGRIPLPELAADNELRVVADCRYSRSGEGLHRFVDPVDRQVYLYTQFETADAHRMFTCFDQPDLKATFQLSVLAPEGWEVITNEAPEAVGEGRWTFAPTPRVSTYITALVAGPYHVVRDEYRRPDGSAIPLGVFCRASLAEHLDADAIIDVTRQGFAFFEEVFARPYPFAKYDQLFVPEFNAGAMENAGCVTFLEDYVFRSRVTDAAYERRAETILHEMAHMWFGDLVTMRWWDDLWLNESFATYMSVLCQAEATRWKGAWTTFANAEKAWAYRQDQLPSTHPISADIPDIQAVEVNFDGITYAKGASVLKQLVAYVGRDNFLEGVRRYFDQHAWGNTVLDDLLGPLEETSGRDLTSWSKEWLETAGVNTLRPVYETDGDGTFTSFTVLQEAKPDYPTLRSHRVAIGLYDRTGEGIVRRRRVELDVVGERTDVPELVGERRPDLVLVNDDDLTYAKIRLDEHSLRTLVEGIGDVRDGLPRALCWSAAWDMTRDAEMATRDYVRLVLSGIRGVTDISVTQTLLRQARTAVHQYADPAWRTTGLQVMADALLELAQEAEPGSDFQLCYVQAFAAVATSNEHLAFVRGLLEGTQALEGLTVDTELRWGLLRRLVVTGAAGPAEIDDEYARDATAAGERHAAACKAAIPTTEAKADAWARIIGGELPNAVFRATLGGFVEPEQVDLLMPYVDGYFSEVGRLWAEWSSDMAQTFAELAYPFLVIDQSTVARTDAYIEAGDPPPALRRLLLEGRDGVGRALRARAKDASAG
ncbi:Membrane alanyl aminopeptidase Metallo peptidase. MEROPS family M01 [Thermomonospora echinospora]|uniref:Aminopeptidase N n=1 Tax=Thermomonospora echinospora TaxID=1992 RepID=A0A1H6B3H8_9ACTN|nr:aminopeptidase N [Thermomonospora echinospora]SEG55378.1 Membrane alanyl aminopeptidase Metallo peptidase. MEROPS family M01 [Thermomonospora echinospora]